MEYTMQDAGEEKRPRGRPQVRCDDDTRRVIVEAANDHFKKAGYASASISAIAQTAGVSTKTLYRLFPAKADLFSALISSRIDGYFLGLDHDTLSGLGLEEGLEKLILAYGRLTLSADTITITRLVLGESDRFPELARVFYEKAMIRTSHVMEAWLALQVERDLIHINDPAAAIGMLRGMMTMEPQRAAMIGMIDVISDEQIAQRAHDCATLFLNGCRVKP
jgi:AcrR family transcriptional regulator